VSPPEFVATGRKSLTAEGVSYRISP
jgi:hypothetical protein